MMTVSVILSYLLEKLSAKTSSEIATSMNPPEPEPTYRDHYRARHSLPLARNRTRRTKLYAKRSKFATSFDTAANR